MTLLPILDDIPEFTNLDDLNQILLQRGCHRCDLGFQKDINGCCVSRGSWTNKKMIIGEGPGKNEDATRQPFTGPAGELMDKIWASVNMNTNDWYCTNIVLCRPVAPKGSGKQNLTPKVEQIKRCSSFLKKQIELVNPIIIVTLGRTALQALLGAKDIKIGEWRGRLIKMSPSMGSHIVDRFLFPMVHPAAILHSERQPVQLARHRINMDKDINTLKRLIEEKGI